jgi:hypothetical protein
MEEGAERSDFKSLAEQLYKQGLLGQPVQSIQFRQACVPRASIGRGEVIPRNTATPDIQNRACLY